MVTWQGVIVGFLIAWMVFPAMLVGGLYAFDTENDDK